MTQTNDLGLDPDKDPFVLLGRDDETWDDVDGLDLIDLAIRRFQPENPAPLAALLLSESPLVRGRGLMIFSWLGAKATGVVDEALRSAGDERFTARSNLMDGLIHRPRRLSADQVRVVLGLAADPVELVRAKVVAFLRETDIGVLDAAIAGLANGGDEHRRGRDLLAYPDRDPQALFDEGVATTGVRSTYCLAAVERMARDGLLEKSPEQRPESWMGEWTLAQMRRLLAKRARLEERAVAGPRARRW